MLHASPSSRGLGHRVFIPATRVRIPLEMPFFCLFFPRIVTQSLQKATPDFGKFHLPVRSFSFCRYFLRCKKWDCLRSNVLFGMQNCWSSRFGRQSFHCARYLPAGGGQPFLTGIAVESKERTVSVRLVRLVRLVRIVRLVRRACIFRIW